LDRGPQGVEPTMYGHALLKSGVAVFDDLRTAVKQLESLADPSAGEVRVGCTEPLATGFVSAIVDRLSQEYPRAYIRIISTDQAALWGRELPGRNIDFAVTQT